MTTLARGCVAEFIGVFALVFFGAASIIMTHKLGGSAGGLATVALTHGLVLAIFITGSMYISGGQLNPAVSIGLLAIGKQGPGRTLAFVGAQLLGAACGAGMLVYLLTPEMANSSITGENPLGTNVGATIGRFTTAGNVVGVVGLELLQTFALMFAVLTTAVDARSHKLGGFGIGLTVSACIMAFGPLTGSSMNPARTFGPALYGHWDMHWAYWVGPVGGAVLAALVYKFVWVADRAPAGESPER
jgi:MIP family channel proteins